MNKDLNELKKIFWDNHKNIKRKTTKVSQLQAQKDQLYFCQTDLAKLSDEELKNTFGNFSDFVKRWINAEIVTNSFGRHLYIKLGE